MDELHARDAPYPQDLIRHVAASTGLPEATATRVVADVVAYFGETVEEFVVKRHQDLKSKKRKNDDIWPQIAASCEAAGSARTRRRNASSAASSTARERTSNRCAGSWVMSASGT